MSLRGIPFDPAGRFDPAALMGLCIVFNKSFVKIKKKNEKLLFNIQRNRPWRESCDAPKDHVEEVVLLNDATAYVKQKLSKTAELSRDAWEPGMPTK